MDDSFIKNLENDIIELGNSIITERMSQEVESVMDNIKADYRQYKKLIDTFTSNFRTYLRFKEVKYDNEICLRFVQWCESEIEEVHILMSNYRGKYDEYRCLNYVYIKLLDELNSYNLRKPIKINDNITIEVGNRLFSEVVNDIAEAWEKLNKDEKNKVTKIIVSR